MTDVTKERLWELYVNWCTHNGIEPTVKGYVQWVDESY